CATSRAALIGSAEAPGPSISARHLLARAEASTSSTLLATCRSTGMAAGPRHTSSPNPSSRSLLVLALSFLADSPIFSGSGAGGVRLRKKFSSALSLTGTLAALSTPSSPGWGVPMVETAPVKPSGSLLVVGGGGGGGGSFRPPLNSISANSNA